MVVIEIQGYGDFDIVQTKSVWVHSELPKSFKIEHLNLVGADRDSNRIEKLLKKNGFKRAHTQAVTYGGNY
jgi:hypothetical protein